MKRNKKEKVVKQKYISLKSRIVILLQNRDDITRQMLPDLTGKPQNHCDMALTGLRKDGFKVFPVRGPGTPLRIASGQVENAKYINWRRALFLPTIKRMVIAEHTIGEKYPQLNEKPVQLLQMINETTSDEI